VCGLQRAGLLRGPGRGGRVRGRGGAHPDDGRGAAGTDRRRSPAAAAHRVGVRRVRGDETMSDSRRSTTAWLVMLASVVGCGHDNVVQPPPPPPPRSVVHYVSPTGSATGDGSSAQPWDLATALSGAAGKIQPGDTVWLRGGTYTPTAPLVSSVAGAPGAPVVVRRYAAERAVLDAAAFSSDTVRRDFFIVRGNYTVLWGLELTDSDLNRGTASRPN